jgi:hypothetical protein
MASGACEITCLWQNRGFDLLRAEIEGDGDQVSVPPQLVVIQDVGDSHSRLWDLGTKSPMDDPRSNLGRIP